MRPARSQSGLSAFTLVEMMITVAVFMLVGGVIFFFLNTGLTLYAKNTAVNAAHQQARSAVDTMLANIHASVSIPQLVDENLTPLPTPSPSPSPVPGAAGVTFQQFDDGPFMLWRGQNVVPTQNYIVLENVPNTTPRTLPSQGATGLRFNISSHKVTMAPRTLQNPPDPPLGSPVEKEITAITEAGQYRIIYFANAIGADIVVQDRYDGTGNGNGNNDHTSNIIGYVTHRASYAVICLDSDPVACASEDKGNKELRYYPTNTPQSYKVLARNVTSSAPFKILYNQTGGADLRSVAAVGLSTADPQYSNRGFAAVDMFINSYIPFRSKLTGYQ